MTRDICYKMRVLRNGADYEELVWDESTPPNISMDAGATIKSSLQGSFKPNDKVNLLRDELQPCIVIDGKEAPLGVYRCASMLAQNEGYGEAIQFEAYDRSWVVQTRKSESVLHFGAGTAYLSAVEQLLAAAGIGQVLKVSSAAVLSCDREDWSIGTSYLSIINALLGEIGYRDLFFDAFGYAHIEPYALPSADKISRTYSASDVRQILTVPGYTKNTDIFDKANVFICICANADNDTTLVATAVNDSPLSPQSTFSRGLRLAEIVKVNQIAGQAELQAYADRLKYQSMQNTAEITFYTLPEAGALPGTVIAIDHPEIGGIYEETGWSLELKAGALMTHTAKRAVIV